MGSISSFRKFLGVILVFTLYVNIMSISAGPVNIEDYDYDQLMSLLSEQESQNSIDTDESGYESNNIPQYYSSEKHLNLQVPQSSPNAKRGSSSANIDLSFTKPSASAILAPHVEVLHIIESLLRLKGEMGSRIHALINDNFDLLQSIYNVIVAKASKLHGFTLMGISVIRQILEFAVQMIGTWEVNAPSVSIGVNKVFSAMG